MIGIISCSIDVGLLYYFALGGGESDGRGPQPASPMEIW